MPRAYFADAIESAGSGDLREDGTYRGYNSPARRRWLFQHQQRILHDFQWLYENHRVSTTVVG